MNALDKFITKESAPHIEMIGEALEEPGMREAVEYFINLSIAEIHGALGSRGLTAEQLIELNGGKIGVIEVRAKLLEVVPELYKRIIELKRK